MEQFIIFNIIAYLKIFCGEVRIDNSVLSKPHTLCRLEVQNISDLQTKVLELFLTNCSNHCDLSTCGMVSTDNE